MRRRVVPAVFLVLAAACSGGGSSDGRGAATDGATTEALAAATTATSSRPSEDTATTSPRRGAADGAWTERPPPTGGTFSGLTSAVCNGRDQCSAIGFREQGSTNTEVLFRWDGASWTTSDAPSGDSSGEIDCLPDSFCAVPLNADEATAGAIVSVDRVEGSTWSNMDAEVLVSRDPLRVTVNSVGCTDESACTAVGFQSNADRSGSLPLAARWDGRIWTVDPLTLRSTAPSSVLLSVSCAAVDDCVAVGGDLAGTTNIGAFAVRWDGQTWIPTPTPPADGLNGVACRSSSFCVATGVAGDAGVALRWDGRDWTSEELPDGVGPLGLVSCSSEDLCMAVPRGSDARPLARVAPLLRTDGRWTRVAPYPGDAVWLNAVACYEDGCLAGGEARSTPSTGRGDVEGAQPTAAFFDLGGASAARPRTTTTTTTTPTTADASTTTTGIRTPGAGTVLQITGAATAFLTGKPTCGTTSEGVFEIQLQGTDSTGADVTVTVDDRNGGAAQVRRGTLYAARSNAGIDVAPSGATLREVEMPDAVGLTAGSVTVDGQIVC